MKILDKYIIKKFIFTLIFMVMVLSIIILLIDLNEKYSKITDNGYTISDAFKLYFPYFLLWIFNTFSGILIFITVLFFTSQIANNTEIVAIISSGVSFYRFSKPYLYVAIAITILSLLMNHFIIPWGNINRLDFDKKISSGSKKEEYYKERTITAKMSPTDYLFIDKYYRATKIGTGFHYQRFDSLNRLRYNLIAQDIEWSPKDTLYILRNYIERTINEKGKETLMNGYELKQKFKFTPDELLPEGYVAETMNSLELNKFIKREKEKGSGDINTYYVEYYQRTSLPFSVIILTFLALSIASEKRRGGIGTNLAIGLVIAFIYIFSFEIMKRFASGGDIPPLIAVISPNIFFGFVTFYLYLRRSRM